MDSFVAVRSISSCIKLRGMYFENKRKQRRMWKTKILRMYLLVLRGYIQLGGEKVGLI